MRRVMYGQNDISLARGMLRATATPHVWTAALLKRRLLNGIADHDHVPVTGEPAVRLPQRVVAVVVVLAFGRDAVELDAERVDQELVRPPPVVVRVQQQPDDVVAHDGLALGHVRADLAGFVLADEHRVEMTVVVGEVDRGLERCRHAVAGFALNQPRDPRPGRGGPAVEIPGEFGRLGDSGNRDAGPVRPLGGRRPAQDGHADDNEQEHSAHKGNCGGMRSVPGHTRAVGALAALTTAGAGKFHGSCRPHCAAPGIGVGWWYPCPPKSKRR